MLKVISETLLGLLLIILGAYVVFIYLTGLEESNNILLLILSFFLFGVGIYFLLRAGKSDATVVKKMHIDPSAEEKNTASGLENMVKRNNQLSSEWEKTMDTRDQLKMLEIASPAKESSE